MDISDAVRSEIVAIHEFIQAWIRGELADEPATWEPFAARFTPDFAMVGPGGSHSGPGEAVDMVRKLHTTNPDFEIWIDSVSVVRATDALVVATYTEWQRHAVHSRRGFNGRWSTVVFERSHGSLRWAWLHETWLSDEVLDAIEASS